VERVVTDIAIVGAGPAGIAAAVRARKAGRRVVVLDESPRPGGQIWRHRSRPSLPRGARRWLDRFDRSGATFLSHATVVDVRAGGLTVERSARPLLVEAASIVLATGARERFLPFPGWTLPGVVGVGGAQALLKAGLDVRGRSAIVAGTGPLLLPVAAALVSAGARVRWVGEQAAGGRVRGFAASLWRSPARLAQAARYRGAFARAPYRTDAWVERAEGDGYVSHAVVREGNRTRTLPCDLLCVGFGLVPSVELALEAGARVTGGAVVVDDAQRTSVPGIYAAGEPTGVAGVDAALAAGVIAGSSAAGEPAPPRAAAVLARERLLAARMDDAFALRPELRALCDDATIVCRCEDVTRARIVSHPSARAAKLHTRAGMGPCQGRVCGPAMEFLFGWTQETVRPPVLPARVATLMQAHRLETTAGGGR
jgi:NADPH-dependent 2,4-dienoyl-CoA reductase/sulfur reductase-like enzyme